MPPTGDPRPSQLSERVMGPTPPGSGWHAGPSTTARVQVGTSVWPANSHQLGPPHGHSRGPGCGAPAPRADSELSTRGPAQGAADTCTPARLGAAGRHPWAGATLGLPLHSAQAGLGHGPNLSPRLRRVGHWCRRAQGWTCTRQGVLPPGSSDRHLSSQNTAPATPAPPTLSTPVTPTTPVTPAIPPIPATPVTPITLVTPATPTSHYTYHAHHPSPCHPITSGKAKRAPSLPDGLPTWLDTCVCLVAQACPTLCDPMDCSLSGASVHGIFQPRILEWVAISFSRFDA